MSRQFKIGVFDEEEHLISSIRKLQEKGYKIYDVYMPYPIHEVLKLLNRKSKLPTLAYFYGLFGALAVLAFLYYTSVIDWPIVYGGKPFNSFPSFIIITIVLTIFIVTISSLATFSARSKLVPGQNNLIFDSRVTDDKFILVLDSFEIGEDKTAELESILKQEGAVEINHKEITNEIKE